MSVAILIPARLSSTRLPRKLLLAETGRPLIQHTYEVARSSQRADSVHVACDSEELAEVVRGFGGNAVVTDPAAASGSDRIAEAARQIPYADFIVNLQGDEPELSGAAIDAAIGRLEGNPTAAMATLATPIRDRATLEDPGCVKVVFDRRQRAMYFSRSPIPHPREWRDELLAEEPPRFWQHVGLYVYRRPFLLSLTTVARPTLEEMESLEQLRALHAGETIEVALVDEAVRGIDTQADYDAFVARYNARAGANAS